MRVAEECQARKKKRLVEAEQAVVAAVKGLDRFFAEVAEGERSLTKLQEENQMMEQVLGGPVALPANFCWEQLRTRSCAHHPNVGAHPDRGHRLRENQCATKTLCSGCESQAMRTSWRGCARSGPRSKPTFQEHHHVDGHQHGG